MNATLWLLLQEDETAVTLIPVTARTLRPAAMATLRPAARRTLEPRP